MVAPLRASPHVPVTERETQRADDSEANRHTDDASDHPPKDGTSSSLRAWTHDAGHASAAYIYDEARCRIPYQTASATMTAIPTTSSLAPSR